MEVRVTLIKQFIYFYNENTGKLFNHANIS